MAERLAASRLAATAPSAAAFRDDDASRAGLRSRGFAFLLDSLVLLFVTMAFASASGFNLYIGTDSGQGTLSDRTAWESLAILMAAVPMWLVISLVLLTRRGQTVGQYILGLRVVKENGDAAGLVRLLVYCLALHPLFFHPLFTLCWALFAYMAFSLASDAPLGVAIFALAAALLCLIGPFVALFSALGDSGRRALHDRIAGLAVVRLE